MLDCEAAANASLPAMWKVCVENGPSLQLDQPVHRLSELQVFFELYLLDVGFADFPNSKTIQFCE